jgi:hypothetical protein
MSEQNNNAEETSSWATVYLTATTAGFVGELRVNFRRFEQRLEIILEQYRIDKGTNEGGNSANISFTARGQYGELTINSPDSLIQDGTWKTYNKHGVLDVKNSRGAEFKALFIFDKSDGGDPRITATKVVNF